MNPVSGMLLLLMILAGCSPPPPVLELNGTTMGTHYSIKLGGMPDTQTLAVLKQQIESRLGEIDGQMSTYKQASELSRFNANRSTDWIPVSRELVEVVSRAQHLSELSNGAFDTTVQPLVQLWGFGSRKSDDHPPGQDQILAVRHTIGYRQLNWRKAPPALRKDQPEIEVDLSAIAKGYAVDEIARVLDQARLSHYLVEIGGELRSRGKRSDGQPWRIAIQLPDAEAGSAHRIIEARDVAMATSGDYRNYFEFGGIRYSHAIDPRSGWPVSHALASVTVMADQCADADGLATALFVMGPDPGLDFAEENGIAALFIIRGEQGYQERTTSHFQAIVNH
ncbi:MAG: FAD:protein FMN transferase [Gammaproteobacteria bacterium]|nr:FAD:protein FMN transferase [Gammaproteobacteria bacterium]